MVHVVRFGQGVGAQVAVSFLRLLEYRDGVGEELIEEGWVPEPQAGYNDDWHVRPIMNPGAEIGTIRP